MRRFIPKKHCFVIHNSDQPFDSIRLAALLPFALSIHAINTTVTHPLLTTIPLGFPDQAVQFTTTYTRPNVKRAIEIYANFTVGTNTAKRNECLAAFAGDPRVVTRTGLSKQEYYNDLCRSKFVLCPEGEGIDTHRFYEAVFCGATPVVLRNSLSDFYSQYPVKIVDKWSDLDIWTCAPAVPQRMQDFKVVYICPDHNEKYHTRKVHMDTMLASLGFKDIVHFKSGTEGYPRCLADANIQILTQYMNEPILLLEDDVEFTGVSDFDFVDGADAIYFGLSTCGSHATLNYNDKDSIFTYYSDKQVRVQNMLGCHAILYISSGYKQAVIKKLKEYTGHIDIAITRIQPKFRILANRMPSFFQSAKFNAPDHLDSYTNFVIDDEWLQKTSIL